MTDFAQSNLILIVVALLIGVVIAWWAFSRRAEPTIDERRDDAVSNVPPPAPSVTPAVEREVSVAPPVTSVEPPHEGRGLADQGAAATADVTGHMLGVPVHSELPGADGPPDNLQTLKGVGPKLATQLNDQGITRFEQIARLSVNEVAILEDKLGAFKGRLTRDRVVEQSTYLARGDTEGFEAIFGKLGG